MKLIDDGYSEVPTPPDFDEEVEEIMVRVRGGANRNDELDATHEEN